MRKIRVEDAVGETLCHDMTGISSEGVKGVMFRRGHVITENDIPALLNIGKSHIYVWEPDADEIHEDDAALALAGVVCGRNVVYDKTVRGENPALRSVDGLFRINREALKNQQRARLYGRLPSQ